MTQRAFQPSGRTLRAPQTIQSVADIRKPLTCKDAGVAVSPDDVIVVSQVKPLAVLSGVVNHADAGHEVHHLLAGGVVQVIPALVAPVPVDPVQSEPAARGAPVRHPRSSDGTPNPPPPPPPQPVHSCLFRFEMLRTTSTHLLSIN